MSKTNIHDFLLNLGYEVSKLPFNFVPEKQYRFPSIGKKSSNQSASVVLKNNGTYLIYDHAIGQSYTFNPDWNNNASKSPDELAQIRADIEKQRLSEEQSKIIRFNSKANEAQQIWKRATACDSHPYMDIAGIKPLNARMLPTVTTSGGQTFNNPLIIPLLDVHTHKIVNLQFITADGQKRPLSGAQTKNYYFKIDGDSTKPTIFVEGYKDAVNVYHATGQTVVACITADKIKEVFSVIGKPDDVILTDNDNKAKLLDGDSRRVLYDYRQIKAFGKGHKVATDLGAKFYLAPELGSDAGSMTHAQIKKLLDSKPTSDIPVFDVWMQLKDETCDIETKTLLDSLNDEKDTHKCAVLAFQYAIRSAVHVPHKKSIIELRNEIEPFCVGKVHPVTLDNIILYVHKRIDYMKSQGLQAINISNYKNHTILKLKSLDDFKPTYKGMIAVKAPTGSGKTQKVGRPYRDWCKDNDYQFLTIAHLRSLIREMASRLDTAHYDDEKKGIKEARKLGLDDALSNSIDSLSVCLPSLNNSIFEPFLNGCKHVFIDEISQVIETFSSDNLFSDIEGVFNLLRKIIKNADCVIVADANINQQTIDFLESCRPCEKITIAEIEPTNENKVATLYNNFAELQQSIVSMAMIENKNLWITCDSKANVQALKAIFDSYDISNIAIVGSEHLKKETANFLKNPEAESLKYQIVISTSAIASGVSIEHEHFDCVVGFFTGSSIQPTDAYQMLGRIRQCKEFHIFADQNRRYSMDVLDMLQGKQQASILEKHKAKITDFSIFRTELETLRESRKANFANNLIWILEAKKFTLKRIHAKDATLEAELLKHTKAQLNDDLKTAIKTAFKIDQSTATRLMQKEYLSDAEAYSLDAYNMRLKFNIPLDAELQDYHFEIDIAQLVRFNAFFGRFKLSTDVHKDITLRRYREATGKAYKLIFGDIKIQNNSAFTEADAKIIMQNIEKYKLLLSAIGAIPTRFGAKSWKPSKYAVRDLKEIFKHLGITTNRRIRNPFLTDSRFKVSVQMSHFYNINIGGSAQMQDDFAYPIDNENLALMNQLSASIFSNISQQTVIAEEIENFKTDIAEVPKPDLVSDVVVLDDLVPDVVIVAKVEKRIIDIKPCNDSNIMAFQQISDASVLLELNKPDLSINDLFRLREVVRHDKQPKHVVNGVLQMGILDLIEQMISDRKN